MSETLGEKLTASAAVVTFGVGLLAMLLGIPNWWVVFVVGWFVVTPLSAILFDTDEGDAGEQVPSMSDAAMEREPARGDRLEDREDALDVLRERYAAGEIDERTFEQKVERLLATESLAEAEDLVADSADAEGAGDPARGEGDAVDGESVPDLDR